MLYLVRHGMTDACESKVLKSLHKDVPLNAVGRTQILQKVLPVLYKASSSPITMIQKIMTSPVMRTVETAEIIQKNLDNFPPLQVEPLLFNKTKYESFRIPLLEWIHGLKRESLHPEMHIVAVTHGRIIRMLHSLWKTGDIDQPYDEPIVYGAVVPIPLDEFLNETTKKK